MAKAARDFHDMRSRNIPAEEALTIAARRFGVNVDSLRNELRSGRRPSNK
jgi:hypothetical protein